VLLEALLDLGGGGGGLGWGGLGWGGLGSGGVGVRAEVWWVEDGSERVLQQGGGHRDAHPCTARVADGSRGPSPAPRCSSPPACSCPARGCGTCLVLCEG